MATGLAFSLGVAVLAAAAPTGAQQTGKVWSIGLFHVGTDHIPASLAPLRVSLRTLGYEEGRNLRLDWRNLPDEAAAAAAAQDFVRGRVDIIVAFERQALKAARAATSDIPVVFTGVPDPVADGFVKSLARPGGNLTGFVARVDIPDKRVELFKELVPNLRRLLVLTDRDEPGARRDLADVRRASAALSIELVEREAKDRSEIEGIFASLGPGHVQGVFVASPNLQSRFSSLVLRLATQKRVPMTTHLRVWVEQGALFAYIFDSVALGQTTAGYVDRILKGAKAADLPVQQPTKFELIVNLRAAKSLGLVIPQSALIRAEQLIQ